MCGRRPSFQTLTFVSTPAPPYSAPYQNLSNGYGGSVGDGGSATCSGTITTVFTWVPYGFGDEPPDNVIVTESCTASWGGYGFTLPTGSCDNGLGFPAIYTGPMPGIPSPLAASAGHGYIAEESKRMVKELEALSRQHPPAASGNTP